MHHNLQVARCRGGSHCSAHSKKVLGLNPIAAWNLSVCMLSMWVVWLPPTVQDMHGVRLISAFKLSLSVTDW